MVKCLNMGWIRQALPGRSASHSGRRTAGSPGSPSAETRSSGVALLRCFNNAQHGEKKPQTPEAEAGLTLFDEGTVRHYLEAERDRCGRSHRNASLSAQDAESGAFVILPRASQPTGRHQADAC